MLADNRSEVPLKHHTHAITAVYADDPATVGVEEMNLGMPTGLIDLIHLETGGTQRGDGVSKWRAHQALPLPVRAISAASPRPWSFLRASRLRAPGKNCSASARAASLFSGPPRRW